MNELMKNRLLYTFKSCRMLLGHTEAKGFDELASNCKIETYSSGQVVFKEGDEGDRFYLIAFGEVEVSVDGKVVTRLQRGKYFGEIALAADVKRTATCSARERTLLLSIDKKDFKKFVGNNPQSLAESELKILRDKCQLRSVIYHTYGNLVFKKYLREKNACALLEFWEKLRDFRMWACPLDMDDPGEEAIHKRCETIVAKFLARNSPNRVNIPPGLQRVIMDEVKEKLSSAATFVDLETEIIERLSKNHLEGFKKSPYFTELMEVVAMYKVSSKKEKPKFGNPDGGNIGIVLLKRRSTLRLCSPSSADTTTSKETILNHDTLRPA